MGRGTARSRMHPLSIDQHRDMRVSRGHRSSAPWKGVDLQWVQFPPGNWVAPAGSYRSGGGGNKTVGAFETDGPQWRLGEPAGRNTRERRAGLETTNVDADPAPERGR